jgi:hypothetical protein
MWKANGKTTTLQLFLDSLSPKTGKLSLEGTMALSGYRLILELEKAGYFLSILSIYKGGSFAMTLVNVYPFRYPLSFLVLFSSICGFTKPHHTQPVSYEESSPTNLIMNFIIIGGGFFFQMKLVRMLLWTKKYGALKVFALTLLRHGKVDPLPN